MLPLCNAGSATATYGPRERLMGRAGPRSRRWGMARVRGFGGMKARAPLRCAPRGGLLWDTMPSTTCAAELPTGGESAGVERPRWALRCSCSYSLDAAMTKRPLRTALRGLDPQGTYSISILPPMTRPDLVEWSRSPWTPASGVVWLTHCR